MSSIFAGLRTVILVNPSPYYVHIRPNCSLICAAFPKSSLENHAQPTCSPADAKAGEQMVSVKCGPFSAGKRKRRKNPEKKTGKKSRICRCGRSGAGMRLPQHQRNSFLVPSSQLSFRLRPSGTLQNSLFLSGHERQLLHRGQEII